MADDFLTEEVKEETEEEPEVEKKKSGPGLISSGLTAVRDWFGWERLVIIGVALLAAHFLWYNSDQMTIDIWGWTARAPKVLVFVICFLLGAWVGITWQHAWISGKGIGQALRGFCRRQEEE